MIRKSLFVFLALISNVLPEMSVDIFIGRPEFSFTELALNKNISVSKIGIMTRSSEFITSNNWYVMEQYSSHTMWYPGFGLYGKGKYATGGAEMELGFASNNEFFHTRVDGQFGLAIPVSDSLRIGPMAGGYYHYLGSSLIVTGSAVSEEQGTEDQLYLLHDNGTDYFFAFGPHVIGLNAGFCADFIPVPFLTVSVKVLATVAEASLAEITRINSSPLETGSSLPRYTANKLNLSVGSVRLSFHPRVLIVDFPTLFVEYKQMNQPTLGLTGSSLFWGVTISD